MRLLITARLRCDRGQPGVCLMYGQCELEKQPPCTPRGEHLQEKLAQGRQRSRQVLTSCLQLLGSDWCGGTCARSDAALVGGLRFRGRHRSSPVCFADSAELPGSSRRNGTDAS